MQQAVRARPVSGTATDRRAQSVELAGRCRKGVCLPPSLPLLPPYPYINTAGVLCPAATTQMVMEKLSTCVPDRGLVIRDRVTIGRKIHGDELGMKGRKVGWN